MPMPFSMPSRIPPMPPRPMPKTPEKPLAQVPLPRGLFKGPGDAPSWDTLKYRAAKEFQGERSALPNTWRKIEEGERMKFIEKLRQIDPTSGAISEQGLRERILPKLKQELGKLDAAGKISEKEDLKNKMKMFGIE